MSTITAVLEADADGTLHLPLPAELRQGKIEVTATLKPANGASAAASAPAALNGFGCLRGQISLAPDFNEPLEDFKDYQG